MHELMMSPAGRTVLRSVLILAVFLVSWNAARVVGKRLEQRRNSLHVRFAVSCAKGLIAIAAVAAFCMQFSGYLSCILLLHCLLNPLFPTISVSS